MKKFFLISLTLLMIEQAFCQATVGHPGYAVNARAEKSRVGEEARPWSFMANDAPVIGVCARQVVKMARILSFLSLAADNHSAIAFSVKKERSLLPRLGGMCYRSYPALSLKINLDNR